MMACTFDALSYAKKLKTAGFTEKQSEVQTMAMTEVFNDISLIRGDIKKLDEKITRLDEKITSVKKDLTIRLGSMIFGATTLTIAVLGFLMKFLH